MLDLTTSPPHEVSERLIMTIAKLSLVLVCLITGTLMAQQAKVTQQEAEVKQLLSKDLTDLPNKEGLMITVEYPPGRAPPRRAQTGGG